MPDLQSMREQTVSLAQALGVVGLINVQYAIKNGVVYVLEVNPRASRTIPFVSKAIGVPLASLAARVMVGETFATFTSIFGTSLPCTSLGWAGPSKEKSRIYWAPTANPPAGMASGGTGDGDSEGVSAVINGT